MQLLACCLLPVACLPFASCLLRVAYCQLPACLLQFACLPVAYCLVCCLVCITFFLSSPAQHTVTHTQIKLLQTCPTWQAVNTSCLHISRSNGNESKPKTPAFTSNVKCTQTLQQGMQTHAGRPKHKHNRSEPPTQTTSTQPNTTYWNLLGACDCALCNLEPPLLLLYVGVFGNCAMTVWWHGVSFYWHGVTFSSDMGWLFGDMEWVVDDV